MDNLDELVINFVTAQNGRQDYYAGRNIANEIKEVENSLYGVAQGSDNATNKQKKLRNEMSKTRTEAQLLGRAFRWLGGFLALGKLKDYADDWTKITSQLRLLTDSEEERIALQERLYQLSQDTRNSTMETVDLYTKLTMNAQSLNLSQEKRLKLTELINKALIAGGGSTEDNKRVLLQFGQALGIGRFQGQDLKSILQNNIGFAKNIAEGLGVDVGQLTKMGARGELTSERVINAILKQQDAINEKFNKTSATLNQSLGMVNEAFMQFIGKTDEAYGITKKLASGLQFLAEHIKIVGDLIGLFLIKKLFDMRRVFLESRAPIGTFTNSLQMLASGEIKNGLLAIGVAGWKAVAPFIALAAKLYAIQVLYKLIKELWNLFTGKENIFELAWMAVFDKIEERLGKLPDTFSEILAEMAQMVKEWFAETGLGKFFNYEAPLRKNKGGYSTFGQELPTLKKMSNNYTTFGFPITPNTSNKNVTQNQTFNITVNESTQGKEAAQSLVGSAVRQATLGV